MSKSFLGFKKHLHLSVLLFYSLLTLLLTWPLLIRLTTHVPGIAQWAFDESTFIWNAWYFKHALVDNLSNPLHTELIYYPLGIGLILHTYNFFHAIIAQPLFLAVNLPFGSNVALLASTILSGYGTFLLVRYLLHKEGLGIGDWGLGGLTDRADNSPLATHHSTLAALIAGLLYAFASNRAVYAALGHYDMITTQWIPFYALMLLRSLDSRLTSRQRYKSAALAGLFFALNGLAEMITALFLGIFTLIVIVLYLTQKNINLPVTPSPRHPLTLSFSYLVTPLTITALTAFILWSPALIPILIQFFTSDFSLKGWGEAIPLSVDLLGWFTPTVLHPLFGDDLPTELRRVQLRALEESVTGFRDVNTVFLGWMSIGLALVATLAFWRKARIWVWTTVVFGLFTLGPFLQVNGQYKFNLDGVDTAFPMPYALLHYIPIIRSNRAPNRNSVLLMLGVAVLVGYGVYWIIRRWGIRDTGYGIRRQRALLAVSPVWVSTVLAGVIVFEHLALPLPLSDARVPAVYEEIAQDPRPVSVMHLPLGWRDGFGVWGPERTQLQYLQTAHGKPMLGGNISRAPDFKMGYFQRIPFFQAFRDIQFGQEVSPEARDVAKAQADELIYLYNVGYLLLFPPIPQRFPYVDHWQESWTLAKEVLPLEAEPFWAEDGIEAYQIVQIEGNDRFELDLGIAGTYAYRGEGWDESEIDTPYSATATWATAPESRLFLPLRHVNPDQDYTLSMQAHPFAYPGSPPQSVTLHINQSPFETKLLSNEWQTIAWQIPGSVLLDTLNRIQLRWAYAAAPRHVLPNDRQIGSTGVQLPVDADLKAFGDGGFIALFDEAGNQIEASANRRGVNVTLLDGQSGEILVMKGFDTAANQFESEALGEFLTEVEEGQSVLVATSGDATAFLTEEAIQGLRRLGADITLDGVKNQYFVLIGLQNAPLGSAALEIGPDEAFLRINHNRDRRNLAAAVDWVKLEPSNE